MIKKRSLIIEKTEKEKGNALFMILIAVALFAALSYAVTQSGRSGGGIDKEKAIIEAAQVIQYASSLRNEITKMRVIGGVTSSALDFDAPGSAGYNAPVPENEVFNPLGGDQVWEIPSSTYLSSSQNPQTWLFLTKIIPGVSSGLADRVMWIWIEKNAYTTEFCTQINKNLGLATPIVNESIFWQWDSYPGAPAACIGSAGSYLFYFTLVEN